MDYVKKAWAFIMRRLDDVIQVAVMGGTGALVGPMLFDDVSMVAAGALAVAGRLSAYVKLGLNK